MKTKGKYWKLAFLAIVCFILSGWAALTVWVESPGPAKSWHLSRDTKAKKILIVFDPDPIYNLDEQVCLSFGKGLNENDVDVTISTVSSIDSQTLSSFDGFVLCANTYNWTPDWAVANFVQSTNFVKDKPVMALTIGSGSTKHAQATFEKFILRQGGIIIFSSSLWLMRPNSGNITGTANVEEAKDIAFRTGVEMASIINMVK